MAPAQSWFVPSRALRSRAVTPFAAALLLAFFARPPAALADAPPRTPPSRSAAPGKSAPAKPVSPAPLSAEDAALVRELALVEDAELLKNLELFETRDDVQARSDPAPGAPAPVR